jgi:hypothetical protein
MTDVLPAAFRHMDYCSLCLRSPAECKCPKPPAARPTEEPEPPEPPPPEQLRLVPVDWPDREDVA